MTEEQKSFPVRYMVLKTSLWDEYSIVDTLHMSMEVMCNVPKSIHKAHRLAKLMNEAEGYRYDWP